MVSVERIERGIAAYMDRELLPSLPVDGGKKVLMGVGASVLLKGYMQKLEALKDNEIAAGAGIVDSEGNVDLETIRQELMRRTPDEGMSFHISIPFIGAVDLKFHRSDIDKMYAYIMG